MLDATGLISGTSVGVGTNAFIVQVNDGGGRTATRGLSIVTEQRPALDLPGAPASGQFQFRLFNATAGQSYTIQFNTNLGSTNWLNLFTTNAPGSSFLILDSGATNTNRVYRALVNP
jgi:hypothetical protein